MSKVLQVKIKAEQAEMASLVDKPFTNKPFGLFSGEFARRHGFHLLGTTSTWLLDAVLLLSRHLLAAFLSSSLTTAAVEAVQVRRPSPPIRTDGGAATEEGMRGTGASPALEHPPSPTLQLPTLLCEGERRERREREGG
jgi:hypothetical protein